MKKPSTLEELSAALRNPIPKSGRTTQVCTSALEAFRSYQPLAMGKVGELMAKEREARDAIMAAYAERTGQQVDYCEDCDLGVVEEELCKGGVTWVFDVPCETCDGLGVLKV